MGAMSRVKVKLPGGSGSRVSAASSEPEPVVAGGGCEGFDCAHPIQIEPNRAHTMRGNPTVALNLRCRPRRFPTAQFVPVSLTITATESILLAGGQAGQVEGASAGMMEVDSHR